MDSPNALSQNIHTILWGGSKDSHSYLIVVSRAKDVWSTIKLGKLRDIKGLFVDVAS